MSNLNKCQETANLKISENEAASQETNLKTWTDRAPNPFALPQVLSRSSKVTKSQLAPSLPQAASCEFLSFS